MRRLGWVTIGLVALAIIEIVVLIAVGKVIGVGWTLLLVLATSALGAWLLKRVGVRSWRVFRADVQEGRPPGNAATDGLLALMGGVLLVVPGFVTDVVGAVLLIPWTRRLARGLVLRGVGGRLSPDVVNSLFGPRRVKAKAGAGTSYPSAGTGNDAPTDNPRLTGTVGNPGPTDSTPIEGEIIDPR